MSTTPSAFGNALADFTPLVVVSSEYLSAPKPTP